MGHGKRAPAGHGLSVPAVKEVTVPFFLFNARGVRNNDANDELRFLCSTNPTYLLCITETFLQSENNDAILGTVRETHTIFRYDRLHSVGGGVLLLVPIIFNCVVIESISNPFFELIVVDLFSYKQRFMRIVLVYRSPTPNKHASTDALLEAIKANFEPSVLNVFSWGLQLPPNYLARFMFGDWFGRVQFLFRSNGIRL